MQQLRTWKYFKHLRRIDCSVEISIVHQRQNYTQKLLKRFHVNKNIIRTTFWLCVASYLEEFFFVFPVPKSIQLRKVTAESLRLITIWAMVAETKKMRTLSHDSEKLSRITIKFHQENEKKNPFPQINNQKSSRSHVYKGEASHKAPPLIIFTIGCFTSFISSVARRFRLFFIPRLYAIAPVACRDDMPSRPFASLTETPEKCLSMSVPSNNDRLCRQDLNLKKIK